LKSQRFSDAGFLLLFASSAYNPKRDETLCDEPQDKPNKTIPFERFFLIAENICAEPNHRLVHSE